MTPIQQKLRSVHLRITPSRIQILELLETHSAPMSHNEILTRLPELDRVTLYRVLDALVGTGLVHRVQGTDAAWRFCAHNLDGDGCPGGHPHLMCEKCGVMTCLATQSLPHVDTPDDFFVQHKQMLVVGICKACHDKEQADSSKKIESL